MAQLYDTQTQTAVEVPAAEVQAAIASGRYLPQKGKVELVNEAGERATVDATEAARAFGEGWSYFSPDAVAEEAREEKFAGHAVAAGLAGAARGLSLGLSDKALTATGAVDAETLRGLQDYNEGASAVGEVAGAVLPALLPGGQVTLAGAATRAAGVAGKKLATSAVGRALVSGAVEGALFGAGELVSEESLGRTEVTGQKAVAAIGLGALMGGATSGLFGVGGEKLGKALGGGTDDVAEALTRSGRADGTRSMYGPDSTVDDVVAEDAARRANIGAVRGATDATPVSGAPAQADDAARAAAPTTSPANPARDFNTAMGDDAAQAATPGAGARNPLREGEPNPFNEPPAAPPTGGGMPPSGGGGGGGTPPSGDGFPDLEDAFNKAFAGADSKAAALRKFAEKTAERKSGTIRKIYEAMGLDFASPETWVLRGLDVKKAARKRLREKGLDKVAPQELLADARFAEASKSPEGVIELLTRKKEEAGAVIGSSVKRFDELATPEDFLDVRAFVAKARTDLVDNLLNGTVDETRAGRRLNAELNAIVRRAERARGLADAAPVPVSATPTPSAPAAPGPRKRGQGGRFAPDGKAPDATPAAAPPGKLYLTFSEAEDLKRRLDKSLKWDATTPNEIRDQLRQLRGSLNGELESRVGALQARTGEPLADVWKRSKQSFGRMAELEDIALERLRDAKDSNRNVSLTDYLSGLAAFAAGGGPSPTGIALGAGAALLNKWGRERLPFILAVQLHKLEGPGGGPAKAAARALHNFVQGVDKKASEAGAAGARAMEAAERAHPFGPFAETLRRVAAMGERELFALHSTLSASPEYRAVMAKAGLNFTAAAEESGRQRAQTLGAVAQAAQSFDQRAADAAGAFVDGKPRRRRTPPAPGAVEKAAEEARKLAERPGDVAERVTRALSRMGTAAPGTLNAAVGTAQRGVAFLAAKAPKPPPAPGGVDLPALRRPWAPTGQELSSFSRHLETVRDPVAVLDAMSTGTVTREHVEALKAVYPDLYVELRGKVLERVASRTVPVTYQQRLALGFIMGEPMDSSTTPEAVAFYQAQFEVQPTAPPPGASGARTSKRLAAEYPESLRLQARRA